LNNYLYQHIFRPPEIRKIVVELLSVIICLALLSSPVESRADAGVSEEYQIKAAYLYNLIKFIQWPVDQANLLVTKICVVGSNPFLTQLENLTSRTANGRPIEILYKPAMKRIEDCNILFIPKNFSDSKKLLHYITEKPILTVGEKPSFLEQGGIVSLVVASNKVQLHINQSRAKSVGFEISGNLLEVAKIVQ